MKVKDLTDFISSFKPDNFDEVWLEIKTTGETSIIGFPKGSICPEEAQVVRQWDFLESFLIDMGVWNESKRTHRRT